MTKDRQKYFRGIAKGESEDKDHEGRVDSDEQDRVLQRRKKKKQEKGQAEKWGLVLLMLIKTALTGPNEGFIRRFIHDFSSCAQCHISMSER